jgi:hypothetical protein
VRPRRLDYVGEEQENPVPFLELLVGDQMMTVGVSGNDLHPMSHDEAKRFERAAAELIVQRLKH